MSNDFEAYQKSLEEEKKKKQIENRMKIKRFDDVFRMMLLVITIMISVGSQVSGNINLWSAFAFILFSLLLWSLGHTIGVQLSLSFEVWLKLFAWAFASLVIAIVFVKFWFGILALDSMWVGLCSFFSLVLSIPPYWWLGKIMPDFKRLKFFRNLLYIYMVILVGVTFGSIVI